MRSFVLCTSLRSCWGLEAAGLCCIQSALKDHIASMCACPRDLQLLDGLADGPHACQPLGGQVSVNTAAWQTSGIWKTLQL